jgi:hypothetical protein
MLALSVFIVIVLNKQEWPFMVKWVFYSIQALTIFAFVHYIRLVVGSRPAIECNEFVFIDNRSVLGTMRIEWDEKTTFQIEGNQLIINNDGVKKAFSMKGLKSSPEQIRKIIERYIRYE